MTDRISKIIDMFDKVGVYAITTQMVIDYIYEKDKSVTINSVKEALEDLAAQDRIVWDTTNSYFRPTHYLLGEINE